MHYWEYAYNQYPTAGLYTNVKNPPVPQAKDVIIMDPKAVVYVQNPNGQCFLAVDPSKKQSIGSGSGHIGFVLSAKYYNKSFKMNQNSSGQSGWVIEMQSANWGEVYYYVDGKGNFTDTSVTSNPFSINGKFFEQNNCINVTNSRIFLPTGNPVSFWRLQK